MRSLYSTKAKTSSWHILIVYNFSVNKEQAVRTLPVRRTNLIDWEANFFNCSESNYHTSFQTYHLSSLHELSQSHSQLEFLEYYSLCPSVQSAVACPCSDLLPRLVLPQE